MDIIKMFRDDRIGKDAIDARHEITPTFLEFIRFIVAPEEDISWSVPMRFLTNDHHWRSQLELTNPCILEYKYILRLEELYTESELIFDALGSAWDGDRPRIPHVNKSNASEEWRDVFSRLPGKYVKLLYERYRYDFVVFGYKWDESVLTCSTCFCGISTRDGGTCC